MRRLVAKFGKDERGAIAPIYVLSLVGLIAMAGIGFDYGQMAALDTELQNAADQAALAAVTQLDGSTTAIADATAAASGLVTNNTVMAGDNGSAALAVSGLIFYTSKADAEADTNPTTSSTAAKFVRVAIAPRKARYALTPITGLIFSPNLVAAATAGLGSAICKVPPMFICNPNSNPAVFDVNALIGRGMIMKQQGASLSAGNYGFLETGTGSGANDIAKLLGYPSPEGDCAAIEDPTTAPGKKASVISAFNTRFDVYDTGDSIGCYGSNACPPSDNSRKDVVQTGTNAPNSKNACSLGNNGWNVSPNPYRPTAALRCDQGDCTLGTGTYPDAMGYPRDICHAWSLNGSCADGKLGSGVWDVDAYWRVNYGAAYGSQVGANPTRYAVYKWERANAAANRTFTSPATPPIKTYKDYKAAICRAPLAPGPAQVDRRVLPFAVVNCTGLGSGNTQVNPIAWVNVFLVEPSLNRKGLSNSDYTEVGDIYAEVIGPTDQGTGGAAGQFVRRDKPFLIK